MTRSTSTRAHGTNAMYQHGCRCDLCRRANADYTARWRNKQAKAAKQLTPIVRCPTCGSPAYDRPTGLDYAATQPGHPTGGTS